MMITLIIEKFQQNWHSWVEGNIHHRWHCYHHHYEQSPVHITHWLSQLSLTAAFILLVELPRTVWRWKRCAPTFITTAAHLQNFIIVDTAVDMNQHLSPVPKKFHHCCKNWNVPTILKAIDHCRYAGHNYNLDSVIWPEAYWPYRSLWLSSSKCNAASTAAPDPCNI